MLTSHRIIFARVTRCGIFAAALTLHSTSFADNGAAGSAADALVSTGVERYTRHDYEGARDAFTRAYEIDPTQSGTVFNLALAELQSGHPLEAARHLRAYLVSPDARPERVESVRSKWLPQAEVFIGRIGIGAPAGATIWVDGVAVGTAPLASPVDVGAGEHDVRAKLGSWEQAQRVSTPPALISTVGFFYRAPAASPAPAVTALAPGVSPPSDKAASAASPKNSPAKIATVSTLGAAAVVATTAAVAFGLAGVSAKNRAGTLRSGLSSDACAPGQAALPAACPQLASAISDQDHDYHLQVDFYVTAGALAAAGIATWFLWPRSASKSAWSVRPSFDGRSANAIVTGEFWR